MNEELPDLGQEANGDGMNQPIRTVWDGHYMLPAFLDCVRWALSEPEVLQCYRDNSGDTWEPGVTPIDRAVDAATGADREFMERFAEWMAFSVFGTPDELETSE